MANLEKVVPSRVRIGSIGFSKTLFNTQNSAFLQILDFQFPSISTQKVRQKFDRFQIDLKCARTSTPNTPLSMAKISLTILNRIKSKTGLTPIYVMYSHRSKKFLVNTDVKIELEKFDKKKQFYIGTFQK